MKGKKIIVSLFNFIFMIICLGVIALGTFSLISVLGSKSISIQFIQKTSNAIFNPIFSVIQYFFKSINIKISILQTISIAIPTALSLIFIITALIITIKTLKEKNCKFSAVLNMICSILSFVIVVVCICVLVLNKYVSSLSEFFKEAWLLLIFGVLSLMSFGVDLIICITLGYENKSAIASSTDQLIYGNPNGVANPQANPAQQTQQPDLNNSSQQQGQYAQQTQSQPQVSQPQVSEPQTFTSSVQPPTNPFEVNSNATSYSTGLNQTFTNPASSYGATTSSYSNPASSYGATSSTYSNPASSYGATTSTYSNPASSYGATTSTYSNPASSYGATTSTYSNPASSYGATTSTYSNPASSYGTNTANNSSFGSSYQTTPVNPATPNQAGATPVQNTNQKIVHPFCHPERN